jgi:mannose-6-phosphate isomerase
MKDTCRRAFCVALQYFRYLRHTNIQNMTSFDFSPRAEKADIFDKLTQWLQESNWRVVQQDTSRPWGGFFVLDEAQVADFAAIFFPHLTLSQIQLTQKLSPKILVVAPQQRLSWQYHFRRAEIWTVVAGPVGIRTSPDDAEGPLQVLEAGAFVQMNTGERHRLIGLDGWGVVAEIWQHTDPNQPSDESDIVRLQDDFGR